MSKDNGISVVTSLYRSEEYIEEFYKRIISTLEKINVTNYEIIFVNDGSPDNSLSIAKGITFKDSKVRVLDLSRNFGHHKALLTGLGESKKEYVFVLDVDLEEKPEILLDFYSKITSEKDVDVVYGVVKERKGGVVERVLGKLFFLLFKKLSGVEIASNASIAKIMSRQFVDALCSHRDRAVFLGGLMAITGFNQVPLMIEKKHKGSTTYSFKVKVSQAINSITSFSSKPLYYIFYLGVSISLFSFLFAFYLIISKIFFMTHLSGWTSLITSMFFLGGLTLGSLGVIGLYLSRIFLEVKERPYTIIREDYSIQEENK